MTDDQPVEVTAKTEWTVRIAGANLGVFGTEHTFPALEGEASARARVAYWSDTRPDITIELLSREVEIRRGPWRPTE